MDRDIINSQIESATWDDVLTQYIAFERIRRILAKYQIYTPRVLLHAEEGHVAIPLTQFHDSLGVDTDGEVKAKPDDSTYLLYFEWLRNDENDGYVIFSEIVNPEELQEILDDIGSSSSESLNEEDVVSLNVPLLLRVMEYSKEDAKTDMDLHQAVERMVKANGKVLTMKDYLKITQEQ